MVCPEALQATPQPEGSAFSPGVADDAWTTTAGFPDSGQRPRRRMKRQILGTQHSPRSSAASVSHASPSKLRRADDQRVQLIVQLHQPTALTGLDGTAGRTLARTVSGTGIGARQGALMMGRAKAARVLAAPSSSGGMRLTCPRWQGSDLAPPHLPSPTLPRLAQPQRAGSAIPGTSVASGSSASTRFRPASFAR